MLTSIGTITVQVTDRTKRWSFIRRSWGFEKRCDQPMGPDQRWIEVAPQGAQTRILLYKATPDAPGQTRMRLRRLVLANRRGWCQ